MTRNGREATGEKDGEMGGKKEGEVRARRRGREEASFIVDATTSGAPHGPPCLNGQGPTAPGQTKPEGVTLDRMEEGAKPHGDGFPKRPRRSKTIFSYIKERIF